jgi:death on curing protein
VSPRGRKEPRWVPLPVVVAIHADQIRQHGGGQGIRDRGLLESALARPVHRWEYETTSDLGELAAAYGYGIARNHPFVDGNKRTAFQVMYVFLGLNGYRIQTAEEEVVRIVEGVASGALDERALAAWLEEVIVKRRKR